MSDTLSIRLGTETDIPAMAELLRQLFSIELDFEVDSERQQRGLRLLLSNGDYARVLVAEENGKVVGMCSGQVVISTAEGAPSIWVEDVVVDEKSRGHGVARALLDQLEVWARERGATRLQLLADLQNDKALEFYRKNGWDKTQMICRRKVL